MKKLFCLTILLAVSLAVKAEVISEHDRMDTALLKAIQLCQAKGGDFSWVMNKRFVLESIGANYIIKGNEFLVTCKLPLVDLSWTAPTTRKDGTPLAASEIQGYEIYVNGTLTAFTNALTFRLKNIATTDVLEIKTKDIYGLRSDSIRVWLKLS